MFKLIESINNRDIYSAAYVNKDYTITYNPETEEIEQVRPLSEGTDALLIQFRKYINKQ